MRLLFDQNISYRIKNYLPELFSASKHVSDLGLQNQKDNTIWNYAKDNGFAVVTFDSDFYDRSIIYGIPPKIIWIRTGNVSTKNLGLLLSKNAEEIDAFLNDPELSEIACMEFF